MKKFGIYLAAIALVRLARVIVSVRVKIGSWVVQYRKARLQLLLNHYLQSRSQRESSFTAPPL